MPKTKPKKVPLFFRVPWTVRNKFDSLRKALDMTRLEYFEHLVGKQHTSKQRKR